MASFIERPRFTCALGGAVATAMALPRTVPVLHAPPGCASNLTWMQSGGCGLQVGGYCGGLSMPGSNVQEREVVFGGTDRLTEQLINTQKVMDGDLYIVLTSCVTEMIGDDIGGVINPLRDEGVPVFYAETGGFKGNSYRGYDIVLQSLWQNYIPVAPQKNSRQVNLWGIAPYFDVFWRGNLEGIRQLLVQLDLEVNTFFTVDDSLEGIRQAGSAALNIIVSDAFGLEAAETSRETHDIPYITIPLPVGPLASSEFLKKVGAALQMDEAAVDAVVAGENRRYYRLLEPLADCFNDMDLQRYAAVVADSNYAVALTRFLADDLGWLPEAVAVTDVLTEEQQHIIAGRLSDLKSGLKPVVIFDTDTSAAGRKIKEHWASHQNQSGKYSNPLSPAFVVGSSLDRELAKDLGAAHLSVSFPVANRAVLDRGYAGYHGGLRLIEDLISAIIAGR